MSLALQSARRFTPRLRHLMFGLFWLLGFQFSPRLADLGDTRLWRLDRNAH